MRPVRAPSRSQYLQERVVIVSEPRNFASLGLKEELVTALAGRGYRMPMPIQAAVLPDALDGHDLLVQAKTGSGKTLAYGLPILQHDPSQPQTPEALVLAPTRELGRQVEAELSWAGAALGRTVVGLFGGGRLDKQTVQLKRGANVVVATPGRLAELVEQGALHLGKCRFLVLDEVDELLQRGFGAEIQAIVDQLPKQRQTIFCSATVPVEVDTLARELGRQVRRVALSAGRDVPAEVTHRVVYTDPETRDADIAAWLRLERPYQCIVFTGSRQEAEALTTALAGESFEVEYFHGDLSPAKRRRLIDRFRSGDLPCLVATDIVARGMDLPGVTHVVNHSLPKTIGAYVHRTGRTGRAGRAGMAVSFVVPQEVDRLERLRQAFSFEAVTVRGPKAGQVRPLHQAKLHLSRDARRGIQRVPDETKPLPRTKKFAAKGTQAKPATPPKPKSVAAPAKPERPLGAKAAKPLDARQDNAAGSRFRTAKPGRTSGTVADSPTKGGRPSAPSGKGRFGKQAPEAPSGNAARRPAPPKSKRPKR